MIDRPTNPARLPVPAGVGRGLVLVCVFVCAACGLVYELELIALASYLTGDSVTQASVVLSVMVFAMGIGSLLAKRLRGCAAVGFGAIEVLLALVGGGSAMALYATFAWFGASQSVMVGFSVAIGILIGAEMPLLMTLIQRIRAQDAGVAVADLSAADYVGALVGGLTFPFLLLPFFGQMTGALLTGVVNAAAGGVVVLWLFRHDLGVRGRWGLLTANAVVIALLVAGTTFVAPFERAARHAVYGDDVRVAVRTEVQEVVLTGGTAEADGRPGGRPALALFLDGRLRACTADEARYHESLVHPAMAGGPQRRVLVLGGGDGLALREVVDYPGVRAVTVVERDPVVVELARTDPGLVRLNQDPYRDARVHVTTADAFRWLRERPADAEPFDVIISALPDPGISASTKFYSQEFYGLAARALSAKGRLAVQAGSLDARPRALWTVESTMRSVGLRTTPYSVEGRLSGDRDGPDRALPRKSPGHPRDWGFLLAARGPAKPAVGLAPAQHRPRLRSLTAEALRKAVLRAEHGRMRGLPPSTLMHPRFLD